MPAHAQAPQRTTATFDDWTVTCVGETQKTCEITSAQPDQGQGIASQITISRVSNGQSLKISVQIPPNVWLSSGITLSGDSKSGGIVAPFRWCVSGRCLADVEVKQEQIEKLSGLGDQSGLLIFKVATQQDQKILVSFKGLGRAFDFFLKENQNSTSQEEAQNINRFDGQWSLKAECQAIPPNVAKASWTTTSKIENGKLSAKYGDEGKPGSGKFEGIIAANGHIELSAHGLTGDSKSTSNNAPEKTPFNWRAIGTFSDSQGTATRIEGRVCTVTFSRDKKG